MTCWHYDCYYDYGAYNSYFELSRCDRSFFSNRIVFHSIWIALMSFVQIMAFVTPEPKQTTELSNSNDIHTITFNKD